MPYIGHSPTQAGSYIEVDDFGSSFNGSNVAFTLQVGGVNITPNQQNLLVMIDGVLQQPSNAFSVSGSTITFTEAPANGADLYCLLMGQSASVGQGTIGADELKVSGDGSDGQVLKSDGDGTFTWLSQTDIAAGTLANARTINGVSFDGSANITVTADANTLSNTTLKSTVVNSSLTSVGTLTTLQVGGQNSTPKLEWFYDHSDGNDYKANISLAGNDLEIRGSSGTMEFYTGAVDGASSTKALSIDSSQNSSFVGNVTTDGIFKVDSAPDADVIQFDQGGRKSALKTYFSSSSTGSRVIVKVSDGNTNGGMVDALDVRPEMLNLPEGYQIRFGERGNLTHNSSNYNMTFNTNSLSNALIITGTGNVGIGLSNTSVNNKFQVQVGTDHRIGFWGGSSYSAIQSVNDANSAQQDLRFDASAYYFLSGNVGIGHTSPQFGLTLAQGDTDATAIGWEDASNTKRASIYCGTSDDSLRFHVNGADRGRFETDGKFVAKTGIRFDGTALAGNDTGVSSSGHGGDLRFYVNGNQLGTLSANVLQVNNASNSSPSELVLRNSGSTGWTGADVVLLYEGTSGNRGQGIYMHSAASDKEWYAGTMYAVDNDRYSICYESRASHHQDVAEAAHEIFYIGTGGQVWSKSGYYNTYNSAVNHSLSGYTNELNLNHSWPSGQGRVHFNYRASNTITDFTFYNGSSGGFPDIEAASFTTTSDYRMKKSVANFTDNVCDKIKLLRPVTYNWKANTKMTEAKQLGFLAHELQEQLPLAVKGEKDAMSEKDDTKIAPQSIKGEALSSYIMKALQEIITRLEVLENA